MPDVIITPIITKLVIIKLLKMFSDVAAARCDHLPAGQGFYCQTHHCLPQVFHMVMIMRRIFEKYSIFENTIFENTTTTTTKCIFSRLREFAAHGDPPWNRDGRFDGKATLKGNFSFHYHTVKVA